MSLSGRCRRGQHKAADQERTNSQKANWIVHPTNMVTNSQFFMYRLRKSDLPAKDAGRAWRKFPTPARESAQSYRARVNRPRPENCALCSSSSQPSEENGAANSRFERFSPIAYNPLPNADTPTRICLGRRPPRAASRTKLKRRFRTVSPAPSVVCATKHTDESPP